MAAHRRAGQEAASSSSDEDMERLREVTWEPPGSVKKSVHCPVNSASPAVPSLRVRPDSHEHDGNELQTTPEFRTHVAKKLSAMLDSCIREIPGSNSLTCTAASDSGDEGFRLLTTSVPGCSGEISPPPALKRRVASSTSEDSEEEKQRRCREAAVSGLDILRHSALQISPVEMTDTSGNNPPKKKKKKKAKKERGLSDDTESDDQNMEPKREMNGFKKKKKKERAPSDETQSDDQKIHSESEKESKKNKVHSDCHKSEVVKDGPKKKKKEIEFSNETVNPVFGKSKTKQKKKKENCNE
ncbi:protein CUSTOS [Leptodactylus fuscus]|uniref:protein CUSTOS n=1 Tax=Leptodactylus fuscus TaxID=238119 RepID=UPI003F4E91C3